MITSIACAGCLCAVVFKAGEYLLNSIYIKQSAVCQALNLVSRYAMGRDEHKRSLPGSGFCLINAKTSSQPGCKALHAHVSRERKWKERRVQC